jgi:glycosyltransferase involved in cell wall biosynthesis
MRIVIDCRYIRERPSGIGAYVDAIVRRLPALAPADTFELWRHPQGPARISTAPNVTERTVAAHANGLATMAWPARIGALDDDSVYHSPHNLLGFGVPGASVVTVHDLMWLDLPHLCDDLLPRRLLRQLYFATGTWNALRHATRILTVSRASADEIVRHAPWLCGRIRVAPNAVAPGFVPAADEASARGLAAAILGTDAPFFLVVGQNQPTKAHAVALQAFAAAARPAERLVLVQRLEPRRGLDALARDLGITDRVIWRSTLPFSGLLTLLQTATALLHPSIAEGFGLPVVEAMASGCPVITSDIAPLREVVGGAGVHVPVGDGGALARALREVADDGPRRAELRARGLEAARRFSWDETAATVLETYREAAAAVADARRRPARTAPRPALWAAPPRRAQE